MKRRHWAWVYVAMLGVLLAVFWLYTRPDFLVNMASQIWACF